MINSVNYFHYFLGSVNVELSGTYRFELSDRISFFGTGLAGVSSIY